jgi:hypothetical protein
VTQPKFTSAVLRSATTTDGVEVSVWGYMRGARPTESSSWVLIPSSVGLIWVGFQYLRYRLVYGARWTVEVRRKDLSEARPVFVCTVARRSEAYRAVEAILLKVEGLRAEELPQVQATLESVGCKSRG